MTSAAAPMRPRTKTAPDPTAAAKRYAESCQWPICCVGGELYFYKIGTGLGWVHAGNMMESAFVDALGDKTKSALYFLQVKFRVPFTADGTSTDVFYEWVGDGPNWARRWVPLTLRRSQVVFEDAIVDFETGEVEPRDPLERPIYGPVVTLPYNPAATCPEFESVIEKFLPDIELRDYVQRGMSLILVPQYFNKSMILLCGEGGTGKSTLLQAVTTAPAGENGRVGGDPDACVDRAFDAFPLVGKHAAVYEEFENLTRRGKTWLKTYTGGSFSWEVKHGSRGTTTPTARFFATSNKLPDFNEDSSAIQDRLVYIPMNTKIQSSVQNHDMSTPRYWADLDRRAGVLRWLCEGLTKVSRANFLIDPPGEIREKKKEVRVATHEILRALVDTYCPGTEEDRITRSEIRAMLQLEGVKDMRSLDQLMLEAIPGCAPCRRCVKTTTGWEFGRGWAKVKVRTE